MGTFSRAHGTLTAAEYIEALTKHLKQPTEKFQKYRYSITDTTDMTGSDITMTDFLRTKPLLVEVADKIGPDAVTVIVGASPIGFGYARMFQQVMNDEAWDYVIFRDQSEARDWIRQQVKERFGIETLTFEPD